MTSRTRGPGTAARAGGPCWWPVLVARAGGRHGLAGGLLRGRDARDPGRDQPRGHQPGRLHADTHQDRPGQRLLQGDVRVVRVGRRLVAGELLPPEGDHLPGDAPGDERGHQGRKSDSAVVLGCHGLSFPVHPGDHATALPPARAAKRDASMAVASRPGCRVAISQYGAPPGTVTSTYTARGRYGRISSTAAGSARGPRSARVCAASSAVTCPARSAGPVTSTRGRP